VLVKQAEEEIVILQGYLPPQLSETELEQLARDAIAETGASTMRDMKQVMDILKPRVQNRASSDQVGQVVRKLLQ
jgi:uncharacterized protein YqeY